MKAGIIGADPKNKHAIARLRQRARSAGGIVPFVGAGLSAPFKLPGWRAFLEQTVATKRPHDRSLAREVDAHLDQGRYEEAAERIIRAIGSSTFSRTVTETFGDDALAPVLEPAAVHQLPRIAPGPVVTTNFDHVLESAFREAGHPFDLVLWGGKVQTASDVLSEDLHILLKLHGDAGDSEDRILTLDEYTHRYGSSHADKFDKPLPRLLERLFVTRTVLFLGCSLQGDRYMQLLRRLADDATEVEHFACIEAPSSRKTLRERQDFLRAHRLTPIWIPPGQYNALVPFLGSLGPPAGRHARSTQSGRIPLSFRIKPSRAERQDSCKIARARDQRAALQDRWRALTSDKQKVAFLRRNGETLYNAGFYRDYIALAQDAAAAAKRLGEWSDYAEFLYNLHLCWRALGGARSKGRADASLKTAERVLRRCPLSSLHGKVVHDIAFLSAQRGALPAAVTGYRAAAKLLREAGGAGVATTWIALGRTLGELGDHEGRVRYAQRAIAYAARHGEGEEEARAWLALAEAHADGGKARLARRAQEKAISLLRKKGDYRTLARALNDLGAAYHDDGNLHMALRCLLRGLWWDQQIDNRDGLASGLSNIAWLHWQAAEGIEKAPAAKDASLRKSLEYFSQAIAVQRARGDTLEVARLLAYRSMTLSGLGRTMEALGDLRTALPRLRTCLDETSIAVALNNRGTIQEKLGRTPAAIRSYQAAIDHADRGPEVGIRRTARSNLARLDERLKREGAVARGNTARRHMIVVSK